MDRPIRHLDTIRARVQDAGADGLWVHPSVDFRYLTGLELLSIERPAGLLIPAQGDVRAAAPAMFAEPLAGIDAVLWTDADGPERALEAVLGGVRRLLVAPSLPTGQAFLLRRVLPALDLELDPGIVAALRRRKTPGEIERLAEADGARTRPSAGSARSRSTAGASGGSRASSRPTSCAAAPSRTTRSSRAARTPPSRTTRPGRPRSTAARRC